MGPRAFLALLLATATGCEDCSERQTADRGTESQLDLVLLNSYAPSVDAGRALIAALEVELHPSLEVTPAWLAASADASVDDVKADGGFSATLLVRDRDRARALVGELLDRRVGVWALIETDAGVSFTLELRQPEAILREIYPPLLPAPSDGIPCFSDCKDRVRRILEKRALLAALSTPDDRLRRLRRLKAEIDGFKAAPAPVRALIDTALRRPFPPGTRLTFHRENSFPASLKVCESRLSLDECRAVFDGGTCVQAEVCPRRQCTDVESCGFEVFP